MIIPGPLVIRSGMAKTNSVAFTDVGEDAKENFRRYIFCILTYNLVQKSLMPHFV